MRIVAATLAPLPNVMTHTNITGNIYNKVGPRMAGGRASQ